MKARASTSFRFRQKLPTQHGAQQRLVQRTTRLSQWIRQEAVRVATAFVGRSLASASVLFPYTAIPAGQPYTETGPIFVHADECQRYSATKEYPAEFRNGRVFRAYDSNYNIIDAEVVNGTEPEIVIESLFQNRDTAFVDVRSLTRGCFTFRVLKVGHASGLPSDRLTL